MFDKYGQVKGGLVGRGSGRLERENMCVCFVRVCKGKDKVAPVNTLTARA